MAEVAFERIDVNTYRIKRTPQMRVDALFFANTKLLPQVTRDRSLEQLRQTAELPHLLSPVLGMPDMHEGYGIPVGGVMASEKIVSAGCVGMDINCGVRLLRTGVEYDERLFDERGLKEIVRLVEETIPVGLGGEYKREHPELVLERVIVDGAQHLVEQGYGSKDDLVHCEEQGRIAGADPDKLSDRSRKRARRQVGSLGSGNHFLELQRITEIYDEPIAKILGLHKDLVCFMIHSGSRALGHQTCLDYTGTFQRANQQRQPELVPVRNLASALVDSQVGKDYLAAMYGAINFAFANRQMMTHQFRRAFGEYMKKRGAKAQVEVVYDVAHNSAKWETHRGSRVLVHRKGATRALPPEHPDNPPAYRKVGHPAFVPGSMGTPSFVVVGTEKAEETYFSVNHGAGRAMSRREAKRTFSKEDFERQMKGVVFNMPYRAIADEAPLAYKDINEVIATLEEIGIAKRVAKLVPLAVIKGN
ncbi:RtcB family protein [Patescibacteria group bacterium]|nr:RtcB family protein [Patescibacteria group bacterium]